jgi:hypothetical protein
MKPKQHLVMTFHLSGLDAAGKLRDAIIINGVAAELGRAENCWTVRTNTRCLAFADFLVKLICPKPEVKP